MLEFQSIVCFTACDHFYLIFSFLWAFFPAAFDEEAIFTSPWISGPMW